MQNDADRLQYKLSLCYTILLYSTPCCLARALPTQPLSVTVVEVGYHLSVLVNPTRSRLRLHLILSLLMIIRSAVIDFCHGRHRWFSAWGSAIGRAAWVMARPNILVGWAIMHLAHQ